MPRRAEEKTKQLRLYSANRGTEGIRFFSLDDLRPSQDAPWTNYVRGVLWSMCNRNYEFETGFDMVVYGNIPSGAGLSSSASLEIVTGIIRI